MGGFVYKLGPYLNQLIEVIKESMTITRTRIRFCRCYSSLWLTTGVIVRSMY